MRFLHHFRVFASAWGRRDFRITAAAPKVVVHTPQIVETLNFEGAYALHGRDNPDCKYPMPWCGGREAGYYDRYGGAGLRRFIVLPYGAQATENIEGVEVPVGPKPFVVSVTSSGEVENINDYKNTYPHDAAFDRTGAEKTVEILGKFLGTKLKLQDQEWALIALDTGISAEAWMDAGFQNAEQASVWVPFIDDFIDRANHLFSRRYRGSIAEQALKDAWRFHEAGFSPERALGWYNYGCKFKDVPSVPITPETAQKWFDETGESRAYLDSDEMSRLADHFYAWLQAGLVPSDMWELESARKDVLDENFKPETTARRAKTLKAIGLTGYPLFGSATPTGREKGAQFIDWLSEDFGRRVAWCRGYIAKHGDVPEENIVNALMQLAPGANIHSALKAMTKQGRLRERRAERRAWWG